VRLLDFYTTQILTSRAVSIECVSWLIKVTNNNDARRKLEINIIYLLPRRRQKDDTELDLKEIM
jgi:hypothetical protein